MKLFPLISLLISCIISIFRYQRAARASVFNENWGIRTDLIFLVLGLNWSKACFPYFRKVLFILNRSAFLPFWLGGYLLCVYKQHCLSTWTVCENLNLIVMKPFFFSLKYKVLNVKQVSWRQSGHGCGKLLCTDCTYWTTIKEVPLKLSFVCVCIYSALSDHPLHD